MAKLTTENPTKKRKPIYLRSRTTPYLKARAEAFCESAERSESWLVKTAVIEFLNRKEGKPQTP